jgi:hypothetical protein
VLAELGLPVLPGTAAKLLALDEHPGKYLRPAPWSSTKVDDAGHVLKEVEL